MAVQTWRDRSADLAGQYSGQQQHCGNQRSVALHMLLLGLRMRRHVVVVGAPLELPCLH
jgi:hypothetical protein